MKKVLIILGIVVVVILVVFGWLTQGFWWRKYQQDKILREFTALENAYKNDSYGGSTPEEALTLFIDALKKGDAELASNYFVPEKRDRMKREIEAGLKNGGTKTLLDIVGQNRKGYLASANMFIFDTFDKENTSQFSFRLLKNGSTKKWLIESL